MPTLTDQHVSEVLAAPTIAVLVTVGPDGAPHAAPVWFLRLDEPNDQVLVSSRRGAQKVRNLERDPRVSLTVVDPQDPGRYVELRGRAVVEDDRDYRCRDAVVRKHGYVDGSGFDPPGTPRVALRIAVERVLGR